MTQWFSSINPKKFVPWAASTALATAPFILNNNEESKNN